MAAASRSATTVYPDNLWPAVEAAQPFFSIPVLRVDTPMADEAIRIGSRVGVVATLPTTLKPTIELIQRQAQLQGKRVEVVATLCNGAFQAVAAGDAATHDQLVAAGIRELLPRVDVIVLAQASMARAAKTIPEAERTVPILSSPESAVHAVQKLIQKL
jgi:Asp/Glu/hydantoin racemase